MFQGSDANIDTVLCLSNLEKTYADIKHHHGADHCKGNTLLRVCTKLFTRTCPIRIQHETRLRRTPGIKPIVACGLGTCGQVDMIDFQSMPNGDFRFLLNYLNHGVKFIFCIPLKRKQVGCIAISLLEIFTIIGSPMILQSDNGQEFSGAAVTSHEHRGLCVGFNAVELNEVINEIKMLWPECRMVSGLPHHSPSNGGVERLNRAMEEKFADTHKVSPNRGALCKHAADILEKKAKKMREDAMEKMGGVGKVFSIGEVVKFLWRMWTRQR
jgi:hypothetical protein